MFTAEQLVLQAGYAMLVAAALAARRSTSRLFLALAAALGLVAALAWRLDLVAAGWMVLLLVSALTLFIAEESRNRRARFTPEDEMMREAVLQGVPRAVARHLIDQGLWLSGKAGDRLTEEGAPVQHVVFLAEGVAGVATAGQRVATVGPGDLIGEATILSGEAATATVTLDGPARFWCGPADRLRVYLAENPEVRAALQSRFSDALKEKLVATNRALAEARGESAAA